MAGASTLETMSPQLSKVVERARREPEGQFHALAHLIDVPALVRAYRRMRKDAAVGVDGVTKEQYGQDLEANLRDLHERLVSMRYRHQPIRRVHIPKVSGKARPIGISTFQDKLVQDAVREVLEAIYEQDFLDCSYGFRPGRRAHDAVRTLDRIVHRGEVQWILEADIASFFDSVDRKMLLKMLQTRVADGSLLRLIGKCLHVGVLDGAEFSEPQTGTVQGSVLSPLLGNVYLHYVLDLWFEREVKPRLRGKATLIRYCDDYLITFEREDDARRVQAVLGKRMERFGLTLHPDKTRLLPFGKPPASSSKGPATFDFLGFSFYWKRARSGRWGMACKTRSASLRRAIKSVYDWCRSHRHQPVKAQHLALCRRLQGHFNYFGVSGNYRSLLLVFEEAKRSWFKWLCRRSQRKRLTWERYAAMLSRLPLPRPRITVRIWGT
ncbi:group II intron reverse transcriptase/maturase [Candidatus Methylomirabilis sp.]|uniref:group II intron reverse transcriptase/maturase n=1 Tax=Candidatus Methylomirabilis sp. TaxID=2032687 RepID=UPI003C7640EA